MSAPRAELIHIDVDRRLGHEWDEWDGKPLPNMGNFDSPPALFFAWSLLAMLVMGGLAAVALYVLAPRLGEVHDGLPRAAWTSLAVVMGAAFAFAWTPCIGPVLTVILATASAQATLGRGVVLLIVYSLGLGVPFLLAGLGMWKLFGKAKPHARKIAIVSGALLAAFGVIMVTGQLNVIASWFTRIMTTIPWLEDLATV